MAIRLIGETLILEFSAFEEEENPEGEVKEIQEQEVKRVKRRDHSLNETVDVVKRDIDDEEQDAEQGQCRKHDPIDEISLAELSKGQRMKKKMNDEKDIKDIEEGEVERKHLEGMGEILGIRDKNIEAIKSKEAAKKKEESFKELA